MTKYENQRKHALNCNTIENLYHPSIEFLHGIPWKCNKAQFLSETLANYTKISQTQNSSINERLEHQHNRLENESRPNEEEESGLRPLSSSEKSVDEAEDNDDEEDDGLSWQRIRKSWWQRWILARTGARGFSLYGVLETAFSAVSKFVVMIVGDDEADDEADYQGNGVSYKDHQLLRITPKSLRQVRNLQELKDSEPDDVRFWTVPAKDKCVLFGDFCL